MQKKKCRKCGQNKFLNEFYLRADGTEGHRSACKKCCIVKKPRQILQTNCSLCNKIIFKSKEAFKENSLCESCSSAKIIRSHSGKVISYIESFGYKVISDYKGCGKHLTVICPFGHKINKTPNNFRVSPHCMTCKIEYFRGENHPSWNPDRDSVLRNRERKIYQRQKKFREPVFLRDNFTCQKCFKKGIKLNAHHLNSFHWDKENRYNPKNGVTLCYECHEDFHKLYGRKNNTLEQYNLWNISNPIQYPSATKSFSAASLDKAS